MEGGGNGTIAKDEISGVNNNTRLPPVVDQEPRAPASMPPTNSKRLQIGSGFGAGAYRA